MMRAWPVGGLLAILVAAISGIGCSSRSSAPTPSVEPFKGVKIVAGVVGDPAVLQTLASQRGEWTASTGAELTLVDKPVDPASPGDVDVLLFPGDRLGELVDRERLMVWPESLVRPPAPPDDSEEKAAAGEPAPAAGDPLQFNDVVPAYRDLVSKYGSDRIGLPYGGSALVLVYRRPAFEREANRKAASEAGLSLQPPKTWKQFDELARFFQGRDWDGDGAKDAGVALALGPDGEGVGNATFLARAASLGQHRDHFSFLFDADSMEPRIDTPPFVEALERLAALKDAGPAGLVDFDAEAARGAFRKGNVAMLIDRADRASRWSGGGKSIGVAPLPGSERVYEPARKAWESVKFPNDPSYLPFGGGWIVGVAAGSQGRRREAAIDFVKYLISPDTAGRIRSDRAFPMLPVRATHLAQGLPDPRSAAGVDPRQWSDAVSRMVAGRRVVPGLRIPGALDYLADLDKARAEAAKGGSPESLLHETAKAWTERTERLDKERQLWHYRRSLNALATLPQPPERTK